MKPNAFFFILFSIIFIQCNPIDSRPNFNGNQLISSSTEKQEIELPSSSVNIPIQVFLSTDKRRELENINVRLCRQVSTPGFRTNNLGALEIPVGVGDLQPFRVTLEDPSGQYAFLGGEFGIANASCSADEGDYLVLNFNLNRVMQFVGNFCSFDVQKLYMIDKKIFAINKGQYHSAGASELEADNLTRMQLLNNDKDIAKTLALFKNGDHDAVLKMAKNKIDTKPTSNENELYFTERLSLIAARSAKIKNNDMAVQKYYNISIKSASYKEPMLIEYHDVLKDNKEVKLQEQFYNNYLDQRMDHFNSPDFQIDLWEEQKELKLDKLENPERYERLNPNGLINRNIENENLNIIKELNRKDSKEINKLLKSSDENLNLEELSKRLSTDQLNGLIKVLETKVD
jgi:hypothetical protein